MIGRTILFGAALLVPAAAFAEEPDAGLFPLRPSIQDESHPVPGDGAALPAQPPSRECGTREALFGSGSQKVWVTRIGTLRWHNPLRPLAPEPVQVVQVAVNGRAGSAYGPNFDNLQQGDAGAMLAGAEPVRWSATLGEMPTELRVIADDGRVLVGPLPFVSCGDAPKVARAAPDRRRAAPETTAAGEGALPAAAPAQQPRRTAAPKAQALPIPQGAIP